MVFRDYKVEGGEVSIPPEVLDKIAEDVRLFDREQRPESKLRWQLEKLTDKLDELTDALESNWQDRENKRRTLVVAEITALSQLNIPRSALWQSQAVQDLAYTYGIDLKELDVTLRREAEEWGKK